jgi:predicted transcriptional regulator
VVERSEREGPRASNDRAVTLGRTAVEQAVVAVVREGPARTAEGIARAAGLTYAEIRHVLPDLHRAGRIAKSDRAPRFTRYARTQELADRAADEAMRVSFQKGARRSAGGGSKAAGRALSTAMSARGMSIAETANALGVCERSILHYRAGTRAPCRSVILGIERIFKVPARTWPNFVEAAPSAVAARARPVGFLQEGHGRRQDCQRVADCLDAFVRERPDAFSAHCPSPCVGFLPRDHAGELIQLALGRRDVV